MRKLNRKLLAISAGIILSSVLALVSINNTNSNNNIISTIAEENGDSSTTQADLDAKKWVEQVFLMYTHSVCYGHESEDNTEDITVVWEQILMTMWSKCTDEGKEYLKNYQVGDEGGNATFDQFASLYDHIIAKYGLEDFIGRNVTSAKSANTTILKNNQTETYVVSAITLVCLTSLGAFYFVKKNRKEHN